MYGGISSTWQCGLLGDIEPSSMRNEHEAGDVRTQHLGKVAEVMIVDVSAQFASISNHVAVLYVRYFF